MKKWLVGIIVLMGIALGAMYQRLQKVEREYEFAMANVKAYANKLDDSNKKAVALQLTVDQMECYEDSILRELDETRKELKVKDKNLKALQAVNTTFTKSDTIVFRDTLFREPTLAVDTLMRDDWYSIELGLRYPNTISVSPSFKSSKHIVVSMKKETIKPPKKYWIQRLFQRKHKVLNVDVIEQNPYIQEQTSRYVEIVK